MEKTVEILQNLVFTKLIYAAEVIIPSDAVIKKAIKSTTHIPWETSSEDTMWEAYARLYQITPTSKVPIPLQDVFPKILK